MAYDAAQQPSYRVTATRGRTGGWDLDIDGVGLTWTPNLEDASYQARLYIALKTGDKEDRIWLEPMDVREE